MTSKVQTDLMRSFWLTYESKYVFFNDLMKILLAKRRLVFARA